MLDDTTLAERTKTRRRLLSVLGATTAMTVAGCSSRESDHSGTASPRSDTSETPIGETPTSGAAESVVLSEQEMQTLELAATATEELTVELPTSEGGN